MSFSFKARSFPAPSSIGKLFEPKVLLSYSMARHTYHMHHIRHPHPIWPSAPIAGSAPAPAPSHEQQHQDSIIGMDDTIEHIVPQCIYKSAPKPNRIRCDMHNFFVFPSKLNTRKSNLQYKDLDTYLAARAHLMQGSPLSIHGLHPDGASTPLESKQSWYDHDDHVMHILVKSSKDKIIVPPPCLRGLIARTVCYMAMVYPEYADAIYTRVLDPFTLLYWHQLYPVTKYEYDRGMFIEFIQGNNNPFVKYPEFLPDVIHTLTL